MKTSLTESENNVCSPSQWSRRLIYNHQKIYRFSSCSLSRYPRGSISRRHGILIPDARYKVLYLCGVFFTNKFYFSVFIFALFCNQNTRLQIYASPLHIYMQCRYCCISSFIHGKIVIVSNNRAAPFMRRGSRLHLPFWGSAIVF